MREPSIDALDTGPSSSRRQPSAHDRREEEWQSDPELRLRFHWPLGEKLRVERRLRRLATSPFAVKARGTTLDESLTRLSTGAAKVSSGRIPKRLPV